MVPWECPRVIYICLGPSIGKLDFFHSFEFIINLLGLLLCVKSPALLAETMEKALC